MNTPCTDEPRIQLKVGDTVKVTRWKKYVFITISLAFHTFYYANEKNQLNFIILLGISYCRHWLFGEKSSVAKKKGKKNGSCDNDSAKARRIRGWFPRACAVELVNPESDDEQSHFTAKKTS